MHTNAEPRHRLFIPRRIHIRKLHHLVRGKAVTEGESREVCATVLAPNIGTDGVPPGGGIVGHDCTPHLFYSL